MYPVFIIHSSIDGILASPDLYRTLFHSYFGCLLGGRSGFPFSLRDFTARHHVMLACAAGAWPQSPQSDGVSGWLGEEWPQCWGAAVPSRAHCPSAQGRAWPRGQQEVERRILSLPWFGQSKEDFLSPRSSKWFPGDSVFLTLRSHTLFTIWEWLYLITVFPLPGDHTSITLHFCHVHSFPVPETLKACNERWGKKKSVAQFACQRLCWGSEKSDLWKLASLNFKRRAADAGKESLWSTLLDLRGQTFLEIVNCCDSFPKVPR